MKEIKQYMQHNDLATCAPVVGKASIWGSVLHTVGEELHLNTCNLMQNLNIRETVQHTKRRHK
jgi:hypothetical protein